MRLFNKKQKETIQQKYAKDTLDRIGSVYSESVKMVQLWNKSAEYANRSHSIPITALRQITSNLKMKLSKEQLNVHPSLKVQQDRTNDLIETIYTLAKKEAKAMNKKSLPLEILKEYKDAMIRGFKDKLEDVENSN